MMTYTYLTTLNEEVARLQAENDKDNALHDETKITRYHAGKNDYCNDKLFKRQRIFKNFMLNDLMEYVQECIRDEDSCDPWAVYRNGSAKKLANLDRKLFWEHPNMKMADGLSQRDIDKQQAMLVFNRIRKIPMDIQRLITGKYL